MMEKEGETDLFNAIVDAVCYWLGYQFKIGRDKLIHEASLRYPIADTITAKGINIDRVFLEKNHPIFQRRHIDLVILEKSSKLENNSIKDITGENDDMSKQVFEFKLAKNTTGKEHSTEHQRVFDDLVRLAYYNLWRDKECFFLMSGKYDEFKAYFVGDKSELTNETGRVTVQQRKTVVEEDNSNKTEKMWNSDGIYKDWFGFKIGERKIIKFIKGETDFGLKSFQTRYNRSNELRDIYNDQINVETECVAISNTRTHAAGLWRIKGGTVPSSV